MVKNPPANAEDIRDTGSMPGLGRSPGDGYGNPFQYSCLENPMDEGAYQAIVQSIVKGQTRYAWGSQGKNAEVVCHSLLQGNMF